MRQDLLEGVFIRGAVLRVFVLRGSAAALLLALLTVGPRAGAAEKTNGTAAAKAPPNLVLITLDTTRADHLGSYGWPHARTPNLDALAARGTRFARCDSSAPITLPSHASLMTGLHPPRHGVRDNGTFRLEDSFETLAERLRSRGYDTAAAVSAVVLARRYGLDQGFRLYDDDLRGGDSSASVDAAAQERDARAVTDSALALLGKLESPFLLWVHYYDPHVTYSAPEDVRRGQAGPHADYDAEIAFMDREVGRLLRALPEATAVAAAGDHGEMLGEGGEATHGVLLGRGARRVPLILAGPGVAAGRVVEPLVRLVDLAPTFLELAGVPVPIDLDGQSLGVFLGPGEVIDLPARISYAESFLPFYAYRWYPPRALSDGYRLFIDAPAPRLYDLRADPAESRNLAPQRKREVETWAERLRTLRRIWDDDGEAPLAESLSEEDRKALAALGYAGGSGGGEEAVDPAGLPDPHDVVDIASRLHELGDAVREGGCAEALPELQRILRRSRDNLPALNMAGVCLMGRSAWSEALPYFKRAIRVHPQSPTAYANRAGCLLRLGRHGEAEAAYREALDLDPTIPEAVVNLSVLLREKGRLAEALAVFERAFAGGSAQTRWFQERGLVLATAGRLPEALADFLAVLESDPANLVALENAARAAYQLGRPAQAAGLYRNLLRQAPGRGEAWKALGAIQLNDLNEPGAARESFQQALRLERDPHQRAQLQEVLRELATGP